MDDLAALFLIGFAAGGWLLLFMIHHTLMEIRDELRRKR